MVIVSTNLITVY